MQHDRTTRPTVRLLHELNDGWCNPFQPRAISDGRWEDAQPLSHLDHPILTKCRTALTDHTTSNKIISCSQDLRLIEVRSSQWRAGVWTADDGTRWTLAAGLAKGGHEDREDFYEALKRQCSTPEGRQALLPTELDWDLLKRETAARVLSEWELSVQDEVRHLLQEASHAGTARTSIPHPLPPSKRDEQSTKREPLATVELSITIEDGIEDICLSFIEQSQPGSRLAHRLEYRLLTCIAPPEQGWDKSFDIYSAMEEEGHCSRQISILEKAKSQGHLVTSVPGRVAHVTHRRHIADASVEGKAVRALCDIFFVPRTDPDSLPQCPECERRYRELPQR